MKKVIRRRRSFRPKTERKLTVKNPTICFTSEPEEYRACEGLSRVLGLSMSGVLFAFGQRKTLDAILEKWAKVKADLGVD